MSYASVFSNQMTKYVKICECFQGHAELVLANLLLSLWHVVFHSFRHFTYLKKS